MKPSVHDQYAELMALMQLHLLQEFSLTDRLLTDSETFEFYKQHALQKKPQVQSPVPNAPGPSIKPIPKIPEEVQGKEAQKVASGAISQKKIEASISEKVQVKEAQNIAPTIISQTKVEASEKVQAKEVQNIASAAISQKKIEASIAEESQVYEVEKIPVDPITKISDGDLDDIFKIVNERFPNQLIIKEIPSDEEASTINQAWKKEWTVPDILIIAFGESSLHHTFLQNMAKAISIYGVSAAVVQSESLQDGKKWEAMQKSKTLRLIIASSHGLHASPEIGKHYRENQKQGKFFLGNTPLHLLTDIGNYLKNPSLKVSLWNDLCARL